MALWRNRVGGRGSASIAAERLQVGATACRTANRGKTAGCWAHWPQVLPLPFPLPFSLPLHPATIGGQGLGLGQRDGEDPLPYLSPPSRELAPKRQAPTSSNHGNPIAA